MIEKFPKLIWGLVSFSIYFFMVGILIFYFNTREEKKPKHYVKKDEHRIKIALYTAKKPEIKKVLKSKAKPKVIPQAKPKPKVKPKVVHKPKKWVKKKVIKEKVVKKKVKKKNPNIPKPKKKKTLDLFANVKVPKKKNLIQVTDKPIKTKPKKSIIKLTDRPLSASERIRTSLKMQKSRDRGVENAYFAKVQSILEGWPAQSNYAGEKATVILYIKPSGRFTFKMISASRIYDFNIGLEAFLEQLQTIGFGRHNAGRTYEFEAKFIAKD